MAVAIPVAANCLWALRMNGFIDNQQTITTFWYLNVNPVADMEAAALELGVEFNTSVWTTLIKPALSTTFQSMFVETQCVRPIRYRSFLSIPASRNGSIAGDCAPSGVAAVVRRVTPLAGRAYQGRIYLPGIPLSMIQNSYLSNAYVAAHGTNLKSAVTHTCTTPTYGDFMPVVYHPGAVAPTDELTAAKLDPALRYQRRREIGVGI